MEKTNANPSTRIIVSFPHTHVEYNENTFRKYHVIYSITGQCIHECMSKHHAIDLAHRIDRDYWWLTTTESGKKVLSNQINVDAVILNTILDYFAELRVDQS